MAVATNAAQVHQKQNGHHALEEGPKHLQQPVVVVTKPTPVHKVWPSVLGPPEAYRAALCVDPYPRARLWFVALEVAIPASALHRGQLPHYRFHGRSSMGAHLAGARTGPGAPALRRRADRELPEQLHGEQPKPWFYAFWSILFNHSDQNGSTAKTRPGLQAQ